MKLSKERKKYLSNIRAKNPEYKFIHMQRYTAVYKITGKYSGHFSIAICSKTEKKIRNKTGKYWAAIRMGAEVYLPFEFRQGSAEDTIRGILREFCEGPVE